MTISGYQDMVRIRFLVIGMTIKYKIVFVYNKEGNKSQK